jgi:hypothetical protein
MVKFKKFLFGITFLFVIVVVLIGYLYFSNKKERDLIKDEIDFDLQYVEKQVDKSDFLNNQKKEKLPRFQNYSAVDHLAGGLVPADINSHPRAAMFRTRITEATKEEPNFAQKYTIATWGCGTGCQESAIVDRKSGEVYFPGLDSQELLDFRLDSKLIIVNPVQSIFEAYGSNFEDMPEYLTTRYYLWEDHELKLLNEVRATYKLLVDEGYGEIIISNLTYNEVATFQYEEYIDQIVQWQGKFCGLTDITGIKLCIIDKDHPIDSIDNQNWFWVIPPYKPELNEYDGKWRGWMLNKYGNFDINNLTGDESFSVTGKYILCDEVGIDHCIPTIEVIKIGLFEN